MNPLFEELVSCPYCGETISVLVDLSEAGQEYIEDCQVCCRPIVFTVVEDYEGGAQVTVRSEDDTF